MDPGGDVKGRRSCPPMWTSPGKSMVLTGADETYCLPGAGCACQGSPGRPATAVTSHAASETRSRAGTPWEGTVKEAPTALLHDSRRSRWISPEMLDQARCGKEKVFSESILLFPHRSDKTDSRSGRNAATPSPAQAAPSEQKRLVRAGGPFLYKVARN